MKRRVLALVWVLAFPAGVCADELTDLKSQLDAALKSIEALRKRVEVLEAEKAKAAATAPPAAVVQPKAEPPKAAAAVPPPEPIATKPAPTTVFGAVVVAPNSAAAADAPDPDKARIELYGAAQADAIYDFNTVNPDWARTLRPTQIPVNCPPAGNDAGCGKDGQTFFGVGQSRFGLYAYVPTSAGQLKSQFEFDFFGTGADAGQTTIRLRQFWGELGPFLAGQTQSLFMDGDVFPNVIDYWGPSGMVFFRNIQLRYTPVKRDGLKVAIALEQPGTNVDTTSVGFANATSRNRFPDLTGQYRLDQQWGHFQVSGILRSIGFQTPSAPGGEPAGSEVGWGINLAGAYKTFGKDQLLGQVVYGHGIANYMNDAASDLATDASGNAEAIPLLGWLLYYDHYWSDKFSSTIGVSETRQYATGGQAFNAFTSGQYASVNLLYYPVKNVMLGGELLWGRRENNNGDSGDDTRFQFSMKYSF